MDFYEISNSNLEKLSRKEIQIYNYILDNIELMHSKTVRMLAKECFVSTSTILRLVKKLGFEGYSEMIIVIKYTLNNDSNQKTLSTITQKNFEYNEEYAKNLLETIRVMDKETINQLVTLIRTSQRVYIFTRGLIKAYGSYIEFMFKVKGIEAYFPSNSTYRKFYSQKIMKDDVVIIINYYGNDDELIEVINKARINNCQNVVSITQANNNLIQNLSDYNVYYFTDEVKVSGFDITSNISVMAILELLVHYL